MIKTFAFMTLIILTFNVSSYSQDIPDLSKNITINYKIDKQYILLPIEENAPDKKLNIQYQDGLKSVFWMRIAETKIDYWVKLDVNTQIGKALSITFEQAEKALLGINNIKQSDTFEFEQHETYRPQFHFTPPYGWMNDPNGMIYFDGEYHLFYQYNPYGNKWGNMHWGHAVSRNLINWEHLPVALSIDSLGDIFSGSAVIDVNNTAGFGKNAMVAIYTSNGKTQQQSIAYSTDRGRTFTKYQENPVIINPGIVDFRDPKVSWHNPSKQWIMALATKQTITFYGSPNLKEWTRLSEFGEGIGSHAGVWECPDLFPLTYKGKNKWVLLVSINPGGPNGGSATQYFIGDFDGKTFTADNLSYPLWIDYGRDNYAGVTFSNIPQADGRRIFIGWMSNWDYANDVPTKAFRSAMTIARELTIKNNGQHPVLCTYPVKEFNQQFITKKAATLSSEYRSIGFYAEEIDKFKNNFDLQTVVKTNGTGTFEISLQNDLKESIVFKFDLDKHILITERAESSLSFDNQNFRKSISAPLPELKTLNIRIVVDNASTELFINDGLVSSTNIVFPQEYWDSVVWTSYSSSTVSMKYKITHLKR